MSNQESVIIATAAAAAPLPRVTYSPKTWRLGRRNGELILQAGSMWVQGSDVGIEWTDVPTVNLDGLEHKT
jgi:hypothetical protein